MTFSALDSGLTGPLFASKAMGEVFSDPARLAAMLRAEAALARAQARFGLVPAGLAAAVEAIRPDSLDLAALGRQTALAGVPTIPFVKAIQARLGPDWEPHVHKGATTQDILDTATALQMRVGFALIAADLVSILNGLARLARAHRETPCIGRTYGQHAAPVSFGFKAAGWGLGIAELAARLPEVDARACAASLGGPVGTLAALGETGPEVAQAFAEELGLSPADMSWHTIRGRVVEGGAWLATLLGALAKMAADVGHLASTEVAEAAEPHVPGRGGSSAMPHKRNPVGSTIILAAHGAAPGHLATLILSMAAAHERPAGALHAEWHALPQLFGLASGALREARTLAEGLVADPARMLTNLEITRGLIFADAAAGRLAPHLGREAAHLLVEGAAERVRTSGRSLAEVLAEDPDVPPAARTDLGAAFDLAPALAAAALWTDRALARIDAVATRLRANQDS